MHHSNFPDTSDALLIQPHRNGVKFIRPDSVYHKKQFPQMLIASVMNFPFDVFILNLENKIEKVNEEYANSFELVSTKSAVNKTLLNLAINDDRAKKILVRNNQAFSTERMLAHEADLTLNSKTVFQSLSVKFPLYDDNQIKGLLGFGCVKGRHSFGDLIHHVSQLGLLKPVVSSDKQSNQLPGITIHDIHFSKRQTEVLRLVTRGMISKKIAKKLGLSYRTVQHYLETIKMKLNVSSKSELIDKVIDYLD